MRRTNREKLLGEIKQLKKRIAEMENPMEATREYLSKEDRAVFDKLINKAKSAEEEMERYIADPDAFADEHSRAMERYLTPEQREYFGMEAQ